jgi:hypothetical protein
MNFKIVKGGLAAPDRCESLVASDALANAERGFRTPYGGSKMTAE